MEALAGRDRRSQTTRQILTAPGERRIVGNGEVEAHHPEQRVQEPFGLAQREMVEEPQGQSGLDGEIRVPPLPTSPAASAGRPGSDRFRGQPHRHIAAANEGPVVGRPVRHAIFRLYVGWTFDFIPVVWLLRRVMRSAGQTAPPPQGLHATTPRAGAGGPCPLTRCRVVRGGGVMRCAGRRNRPRGTADGLVPPAPAAPDTRRVGPRRRAVPARG